MREIDIFFLNRSQGIPTLLKGVTLLLILRDLVRRIEYYTRLDLKNYRQRLSKDTFHRKGLNPNLASESSNKKERSRSGSRSSLNGMKASLLSGKKRNNEMICSEICFFLCQMTLQHWTTFICCLRLTVSMIRRKKM